LLPFLWKYAEERIGLLNGPQIEVMLADDRLGIAGL